MIDIPFLRKWKWKRAQTHELSFWTGIAATGFNGLAPRDFVEKGQRSWLLSQLEFLEEPLDFWKDKTIVEFGPGPAGFVEYIEAARRIAVEPLINEYRKTYAHLAKSGVEYIAVSGEEAGAVETGISDLSICFNVLDHTFAPAQLLQHLSRVTKPGGRLLFQVNVYLTADEVAAKSGPHAAMHPHSFYPQDILRMLDQAEFVIQKQLCAETANECGEHYFICCGERRSSA